MRYDVKIDNKIYEICRCSEYENLDYINWK